MAEENRDHNRTPRFFVFTLDLNCTEYVVAGKHYNLSFDTKQQAIDHIRKKHKK